MKKEAESIVKKFVGDRLDNGDDNANYERCFDFCRGSFSFEYYKS